MLLTVQFKMLGTYKNEIKLFRFISHALLLMAKGVKPEATSQNVAQTWRARMACYAQIISGEISVVWHVSVKMCKASDIYHTWRTVWQPVSQPISPRHQQLSVCMGGRGRNSSLRSGIGPDDWVTSVTLCQVHWGEKWIWMEITHIWLFFPLQHFVGQPFR